MATSVAKADTLPAVIENYALMQFSPEDLTEIIADNIGNDGLSPNDLLVAKVPSGSSAAVWSIPSPDGEDETGKAIEGVIVHWQDVRAYWPEAFGQGDTNIPACSSIDSITGNGDIGGGPGSRDCANCPMAQFGTAIKQNGDKGNGQACQQKRLLFILREGDLLPIVVRAPATSIKALRTYFLQLASRTSAYHGVVTQLGLQKEKSGDGIDYYKIVPKMVSKLSPDEHKRVKSMGAMLRPAVDADVVNALNEGDEPPF